MHFSKLSFKKKLGFVSLLVLTSQLVAPRVEAMDEEDPTFLKRNSDAINNNENNNNFKIDEGRPLKKAKTDNESFQNPNNNNNNNHNILWEYNGNTMNNQPWPSFSSQTGIQNSAIYPPMQYYYPTMPPTNYNHYNTPKTGYIAQPQPSIIPNNFTHSNNNNNHFLVRNHNYNPGVIGNPAVPQQFPIKQNNNFIDQSLQNPNYFPVSNKIREVQVEDKFPLKVIPTFMLCLKNWDIPFDVQQYIINYYADLLPVIRITELEIPSDTTDKQLLSMVEESFLIQEIHLGRNTDITCEGLLATVKKCTRLNSLKFDTSPLKASAQGLRKVIEACPGLTSLDIVPFEYGTKSTSARDLLNALQSNKNLTSLKLERWKHITEEELQELFGNLPKLSSLHLQCCKNIKATKFRSIFKKAPNLRSLSLDNVMLNNKQLLALADLLPELIYLQLRRDKKITDTKYLTALNRFSNLTFLDLKYFNSITGENLLDLVKKHPNVTSFNLPFRPKIKGNEFLSVVQSAPKLNTLNFEWLDDSTTLDQFKAISEAYPKLLYLVDHTIDSERLLTVIGKHPELISLELNFHRSNEEIFALISKIVKMSPKLAFLRGNIHCSNPTWDALREKYPNLSLKYCGAY